MQGAMKPEWDDAAVELTVLAAQRGSLSPLEARRCAFALIGLFRGKPGLAIRIIKTKRRHLAEFIGDWRFSAAQTAFMKEIERIDGVLSALDPQWARRMDFVRDFEPLTLDVLSRFQSPSRG